MDVSKYEIVKSDPIKYLHLDFEFNQTSEQFVNLVSCATYDPIKNEIKSFWLHSDKSEQERLKSYLSGFDIFVGYAAVAEARSFISLGLNPLDYKWIDLFFEYRCLANHNDSINYGPQLVDGKVRNISVPMNKYEKKRINEERKKKNQEQVKEEGFKATHSLAEATFKLLGVIRDTKEKDQVRDLILSNPISFTVEERNRILAYGEEDIKYLHDILESISVNYLHLDHTTNEATILEEMLTRGRYACHTAWMENHGYPIDVEKTKNFSDNVPLIIHELQKDINSQFKDFKPFKWDRSKSKFKWDQKGTRFWIDQNFKDKWELTETKQYALSLDAFSEFFSYAHDYPRGNFGAQMVRYLKFIQSLNGFKPAKEGKKTFWSTVGSDGRSRAYLNPFGAQSSRTQPGATGFLFLKAAWMRALCLSKPGKFMGGIDYGSQEFLIQALESGDEKMMEAYKSGDPYLYLGKACGAIPPEGTKATHGFLRDCFKSTTLGIGYLMTKYGLAIKLTADTGKMWTEDEAQEQIDKFYATYSKLEEYQQKVIEEYSDPEKPGFIKLPCGWYMWGDNRNKRSVANVPIQGKGASIMRLAVDIAASRGVKVIMTLHDAIYIEGDVGKESDMLILRDAMTEAFCHWYKNDKILLEGSKLIRLDPFIWSPDYKKDSTIKVNGWEIPASDLYVDERAFEEYKKFSPYFLKSDSNYL